MSVIVQIVSADGRVVAEQKMTEAPEKVKLPAGASVRVIDAATGREVPVKSDKTKRDVARTSDADGELLVAVAADEAQDEEIEIEIEPATSWSQAEAFLGALAEDAASDLGLSADGAITIAADAVAASDDTTYEYGQFGSDGFFGGNTILLVVGLAAIVGAVILLTDDDDDDGEEVPPPDTQAPAAPAGLTLDPEDDSGDADDDGITNVGTVTITGTAEANSTVEVFAGDMSLGTTTADGDGNFSIDVDLPEGGNVVTATATDAAGNESAASADLEITVDRTAPDAPDTLVLDPADDDGSSSTDNITTVREDLLVSGTAEPLSTVELFNGDQSLGTTTAGDDGVFSFEIDLPLGENDLTAVVTDIAGNTGDPSPTLTVTVVEVTTQAINASIDGNGDVVTIYFDDMLDMDGSAPLPGDFTVMEGDQAVSVSDVVVAGNRITLLLDAPLGTGDVTLGYDGSSIGSPAGFAIPGFEDFAVTNRLDLMASGALQFARSETIQLEGAEIAAFDPESDRIFVTGSDGLQVLSIDEDLTLTLLGTVPLGSNDITSVAVANGVVAVAVAADTRTDAGSVFLLDASGDVGPGMVINEVPVGALPDAVTFTPDGQTILVANEGERTTVEDVEGGAALVDPVGSVSVIDLSGGISGELSVRTAGFESFNDRIDTLRAEGLRLFAGLGGYEDLTLAQDLEPEYIAVSPDGMTALVTLQEANAVAVLDIANAVITDIKPLGLKSFDGLLADFSDRDGPDGEGAISLTSDNPGVFGQFMPDAIASYTGADGTTYYVIANEGDDREDFLSPEPNGRVDDLTLDPTAFPNAELLQQDENLGRLGVTIQPGLNGDTDGDGDVDRLLAYGGRSFSILTEDGTIVFDSGSHIEQFVSQGGLYDEDTNQGAFDDGRSDNKGPEPEGITTGVYGDSVLAFVTLERGSGGVMVYDVTDPTDVEFVQYVRGASDISPESAVYIAAADSPTGDPILLVANEGSETVSVFEITQPGQYTLQLLHFADGEAKSLAIETAPNLAALVDAFEDDYANSITLAGGDNYIPGLFFTAQNQSAVEDLLGYSGGPKVDIAIHNAIGVQASTIGNHEFDRGTGVFASAIRASGEYDGALFPYLSANLDFSGDSNLLPLFVETLGDDDLEFARDLSNTIVPSAVIEEGGELIGLVGATTQVLGSLTSLGGVTVEGPDANDMQALADILQPYIDDLMAQGVNKIIVMSHLQQIELEEALAPLLEGVDIILAAGSNTRLSDEDDDLVAFPGHEAASEGPYPIVTAGSDGAPTLIVNTDNEYTYLGRLVVDFDAEGEIILDSLDDNLSINGAYASTAENVAEAWDTTIDNLEDTAFAEGTRGSEVQMLVDAVNAVLQDQGSNVFGFSDVFLEGERAFVRSQETNLGNLTADANADAAREAAGLTDDDVVVAFKNGGGIRDSIGSLVGTGSDVMKGPNEGGVVTELDVGAVLAFNNGLVVFDTTPQGLLNILNSPNVFQAGNGGFGQLSGLQVSYDPDLPAGSRVIDVALVDALGNKTALVDDGEIVAGAPDTIKVVTLDFIAGNDGDGTQIAENGTNFRYIVDNGDGTYSLSEPLPVVEGGVAPGTVVVDIDAFAGDALGEQQALADYLTEDFGSLAVAFDMADTPQELDLRIQNITVRDDTVLEGTAAMAAMSAPQIEMTEALMIVA